MTASDVTNMVMGLKDLAPLKDVIFWIFTGIISIMTILQTATKYNPWVSILKGISNILNQDINNQLLEIQRELKEQQEKLNKHITDSQNESARTQRLDILNFTNEEMHERSHTQEQWTNVMENIDDYLTYCEVNNIANEKATSSIEWLRKKYKRHMDNNDFLQEGD